MRLVTARKKNAVSATFVSSDDPLWSEPVNEEPGSVIVAGEESEEKV